LDTDWLPPGFGHAFLGFRSHHALAWLLLLTLRAFACFITTSAGTIQIERIGCRMVNLWCNGEDRTQYPVNKEALLPTKSNEYAKAEGEVICVIDDASFHKHPQIFTHGDRNTRKVPGL
jgi:hypothetical protein